MIWRTRSVTNDRNEAQKGANDMYRICRNGRRYRNFGRPSQSRVRAERDDIITKADTWENKTDGQIHRSTDLNKDRKDGKREH